MLEIWAKYTPKNHAIFTFYRAWPGQCAPNLSHACHTAQILPTLVFTAAKIAHSVYFERFVGFIAHFLQPPNSQHHEHRGRARVRRARPTGLGHGDADSRVWHPAPQSLEAGALMGLRASNTPLPKVGGLLLLN